MFVLSNFSSMSVRISPKPLGSLEQLTNRGVSFLDTNIEQTTEGDYFHLQIYTQLCVYVGSNFKLQFAFTVHGNKGMCHPHPV